MTLASNPIDLDAIAAPAILARVRELYRVGLYLQCHAAMLPLAPQGQWIAIPGAEAGALGARVAFQCGAAELAGRLSRRAFHSDRQCPDAVYFCARRVLERHGPLAALRFQEPYGDLAFAPAEQQSDWLAFRGFTLSILRDFTQAHAWMDRALAKDPSNPWISIEHASILEYQDRRDEALAVLTRAMADHPDYRPAIQSAASLYQQLGDDDTAMRLLRGAAEKMESIHVLFQLAGLQQELGHYADARTTLRRVEAFAPLMENPLKEWLIRRDFDLTHRLGDYAAAVDIGAQLEDPFSKETTQRLRDHVAEFPNPPAPDQLDYDPPHRVRLPVGFVRQHHMTCAPATLSVLCRYFDRPADHLAIAEAICYDGTPHHKERAWVHDAGYIAREFTLTWDTGVELINRRIPFALTTVAPESGHSQAIIGYDALRRTFLVRDPGQRGAYEILADELLKTCRSTGPRCLLLLPPELASRLDGLDLPDAPLFDMLFGVQQALELHDRAQAQALFDGASGPATHRVMLYAQRCLASYDANHSAVLAATEELLKQFPEDGNLLLSKLSSLYDLARREDRIALLKKACEVKGCHPVFWQRLAEELSGDARQAPLAVRLLERRVRRTPRAGAAYITLANALWEQRQRARAFDLYRIAACMDDKDERMAKAYFTAARHFNKTDDALAFLRERFARYGDTSYAPARTLFNALVQLDRDHEAFVILEEALTRRPKDGYLALFAADVHVRYQKIDRGTELLARAKPLTHRMVWLAAAAEIAQLRCQQKESLALWQEIAQQNPLHGDAQRAIARLLAETQGRAAALEYVRALAERFPHHFGIFNLLIGWERSEDLPTREATIRRLIAIDPADAWGHRELALLLADAGRETEALAEAEHARMLEPADMRTYTTMTGIYERLGRLAEARDWARRTVRLSADSQFAIAALMRLADSTQDRAAELTLVEQELRRQVTFGDGLLTYASEASTVLRPAAIGAFLREAHAARPDLWQTWSVLIQYLASNKMIEEAEALANQAVKRLPLVPRMWVDLSHVYAAKGDVAARAAALEEALALAPAWSFAARQLAVVHESQGAVDKARQRLEQAIARDPLDAHNHAYLAQVLWKQAQRPEAIERLNHALILDPTNESNWGMLNRWYTFQKTPGLAVEKLREMTRRRAGDPAAWRQLARVLPETDPETLAAIDQAITLEPRNAENYDIRAWILAGLRRFDEAQQACRPAILGDAIPASLRARSAWVLAQAGQRKEAITAMRAVVASDQSSYWAWQRLAEWLNDENDTAAYMETCQRIVALWPRDAAALEFLAHARLQTGGRDHINAAKLELRRALQADPDRDFAADRLFDLLLDDKDFGPATQIAGLIRQQGRPAAAALCEARLALAMHEGAAAVGPFTAAAQKLLAAPTARRNQVDRLVALAKPHAACRRKLDDLLLTAAHDPLAGPECIAAAAIAVHIGQNNWKAALGLVERIPVDTPAWRQAAHEYLHSTGTKRRFKEATLLLTQRRAELQRHPPTWGTGSYVLCEADRYADVISWMTGWDTRPDVEPWMLMNLGIAFTQLKRFDEAARVHAFALGLKPDMSKAEHLIWLAIYQPALFLPGPNGAAPARALIGAPRHDYNKVGKETLALGELFLAIARARQARHPSTRFLHPADLAPHWQALPKLMTGIRSDILLRQNFRRLFAQIQANTFNPSLWTQCWWRSVQCRFKTPRRL